MIEEEVEVMLHQVTTTMMIHIITIIIIATSLTIIIIIITDIIIITNIIEVGHLTQTTNTEGLKITTINIQGADIIINMNKVVVTTNKGMKDVMTPIILTFNLVDLLSDLMIEEKKVNINKRGLSFHQGL
jgi:hypothetical protein